MKSLPLAFLLALAAIPTQAQQARVVTTCGSWRRLGRRGGDIGLSDGRCDRQAVSVGGGGGGSIVGGTTPITGTCPSGQFLYNNSGVVGCSASSATDRPAAGGDWRRQRRHSVFLRDDHDVGERAAR